LGFTFICGKSRRGNFLLHRRRRRDRAGGKLKKIKEGLRERGHKPNPEKGSWVAEGVRGSFGYHAVATNHKATSAHHYHVKRLWLRTLRRRSQKDKFAWERIDKLAGDFLPKPRILHPWPSARFVVMHPRWEPSA